MTHADVAKCVEHALVRDNPVGAREYITRLVKLSGHGNPSLSPLIGGRPARRGQFESVKRKSGRNSTSGERPVAEAFGRLPGARGYRHLRHLAGMNVGTKSENLFLGAVDDLELERSASVIMPNLHCVDAVPVRSVPACKQE